ANEPDDTFIHDVLHCGDATTAAEEKDGFELIVSKLAGEQVNSNMLSNMYEEIGQMIEENEEEDAETEPHRLNYHDVEHIITSSGMEYVDTEKEKEAIKTEFDNEQHEIKAK